MFWAYNANSPQIDIILCKEDLTLQELLDQENVLQELKAQNLKLIEFLLKPEILRELITLITTEPSADLDESEQYKYPNLACELLTSDLPAINERLASEEILNKLYCFLENEPPLNPLLSSYFSRTLSILISRKSEQNWYSYQYTCLKALEFLKEKKEFMELLFKHMGTSSIMDLLHNLVTLIEGPELKQSLRGWLQTQNVIPNLVALLNPYIQADCQVNAASALCSIIQKLRENAADLNEKPESDPILTLLESTQTIELVLSTAFNAETICETSIESAIDVLMTLMQPHLPGEPLCRQTLNYTVHDKIESGLTAQNVYIESPQPVKSCHNLSLSDIIMAISPYIKKMKTILQTPIKTEPIVLTSGTISPPFGRARLVVAKFVAVLISLNNTAINKEIILCDIPELLLDLFYAYSSNNFLHTEVEKLIAYAIDNLDGSTVTEYNDDLILAHLLKKCNLIRRLHDMWEDNAEKESEGKFRRAYMGHVIRIASLIHIEDSKMSTFHDMLTKEVSESCLNDWNAFVNDPLKNIIEIHSSCLGGVRPKMCQSSDNSFEESVYKENKSGFKEFDPDDDQNMIFINDSSALSYGLNNDVTEDEQERQSEKFYVICSQKWPSFCEGLDGIDENDSEENDRMNVWKAELKLDGDIRSWGSDDEYADEERENIADPWAKLGNVSDPWAETSLSSNDSKWNVSSDSSWNVNNDSNWANFEENFTTAEIGECNSSSPTSTSSSAPSSANANVEQYSLFGTALNDKTAVLNKFSTLKIRDGNANGFGAPFKDEAQMLNGEWGLKSEDANMNGGDDSFDLPTQFACFDGQGKDNSDEMLNLESICGNTLAEKIANAENDIRNKDEFLMRGFQEQQQNFHSVNSMNEGAAREQYYDNVEDGGASAKNGNAEQTNASTKFVQQPVDCLTENSVDFVTAENSTSDAESTEFGDPDNSLEFEMDDCVACDRNGDGVHEKSVSVHDSNANVMSNDCNDCRETFLENVPTNETTMVGDKYNSDAATLENDVTVVTQKIHSLANGDIADSDIITDCDKSEEDASKICSSTLEQSNENANSSIITDPA